MASAGFLSRYLNGPLACSTRTYLCGYTYTFYRTVFVLSVILHGFLQEVCFLFCFFVVFCGVFVTFFKLIFNLF